MVLVTDVPGQAEVVALVIEAKGEHVEGAILVFDRGLAGTLGRVQAHTEALLFAEATGDIGVGHGLATVFGTDGQSRQRLVRRALGQDVDRAANAAATWGCAVEEGVGAAEHFHPLDELGGYILAR